MNKVMIKTKKTIAKKYSIIMEGTVMGTMGTTIITTDTKSDNL